MNCIEIQAVLNDYVDGELAPAETARVETHLVGCAGCRAQVGSLRNLVSAAAALPKEIAPNHDLWPEVGLALRAGLNSSANLQELRPLRRSSPTVHWLLPLAAAASIVYLATFSRPPIAPAAINAQSWTVASLEGAPRVGRRSFSGQAQLHVGQWVETDGTSRAKLASSSIGEVSVEPNSRLRLTTARSTDHTLQLAQGKMSAFIWAPPRLFFVDTPAARAIDLGCAYTMTVADNGDGELHVTLGYVALEHGGRESIIPAHAKCVTRRGFGPGTPFADDAPEPLRAALTRFDFVRGAASRALKEILAQARPEDAVTLWHLLARTQGTVLAEVFDKLAEMHRPPAGVTRAGILAGDATMRQAWGRALGIGTF
jgi:hypothetical protein